MRPCRHIFHWIVVVGMAGGLAACSGGPSSLAAVSSPLSPSGEETLVLHNELVSMQAVPNAAFRTEPAADPTGAIRGDDPLVVQFNNCQSRPSDEGDDLRFTYDFDSDGTIDAYGHCRWEHTYAGPATARVCVSDRRGNEACRDWEIRPYRDEVPVPPVPTPLNNLPPSATWSSISIACGTRATSVVMLLNDPEGDASMWSVAVTGGTLTSASSGGPVASGGRVTLTFNGIQGLNVVRMHLVDARGMPSVPVTRYGPSPTCGGQTLQILG